MSARSVTDPVRAANDGYLTALADVPTDAVASTLARPLCRPVVRRHRALNPWSDTDAALLQTIARGEGTLTSSGPARLVLLGARDVTILSVGSR